MADEIETLDKAARDSSGRADACGGAYARYVDDMVLVCPDGAAAQRLKRRIEAYLARIGLRLNHKNATPPPMTRREARLWVTDNRTGLGFSGPISEMLPVAFFDRLADAGNIPVDRKLALGLLHDPGLDDTRIYVREDGESAAEGEKRENALERLKTALSAPELRYNDRVSAYRRLWLMAAADASEGTILACRFIDLVVKVEDHKDKAFAVNEAHGCAVAIYDAIERVMRIDLSLAEAENLDRQTFVTLRNKLARLQPHQLADAAAKAVFERAGTEGKNASPKFLKRFDIAAQRLVILNAAFAQVRDLVESPVDTKSIAGGISPARFGSLWTTLRRHAGNTAAPKEDAPVERDNPVRSVFAALHQDIVGVERWAARATSEVSDDQQLPDPEFGPAISDAASQLLKNANAIRSVWLRKEIEDIREPHRDAAAALVNMASQCLSKVFEEWGQLLPILLGKKESDIKLKAIPQPPGLRVNAALLIDNEGKTSARNLTLVEFDEEDEGVTECLSEDSPRAVVGIRWPDEPKLKINKLRIYETTLDGFQPMVETGACNVSPAEIAATYRGLLRNMVHPDSGRQLVPTAYSFFVRDRGAGPEYRVVAWAARDTATNGHAFIRCGDRLQVIEVPERDAFFWRFGWAVCDHFDHVDRVRDDPDA